MFSGQLSICSGDGVVAMVAGSGIQITGEDKHGNHNNGKYTLQVFFTRSIVGAVYPLPPPPPPPEVVQGQKSISCDPSQRRVLTVPK